MGRLTFLFALALICVSITVHCQNQEINEKRAMRNALVRFGRSSMRNAIVRFGKRAMRNALVRFGKRNGIEDDTEENFASEKRSGEPQPFVRFGRSNELSRLSDPYGM